MGKIYVQFFLIFLIFPFEYSYSQNNFSGKWQTTYSTEVVTDTFYSFDKYAKITNEIGLIDAYAIGAKGPIYEEWMFNNNSLIIRNFKGSIPFYITESNLFDFSDSIPSSLIKPIFLSEDKYVYTFEENKFILIDEKGARKSIFVTSLRKENFSVVKTSNGKIYTLNLTRLGIGNR